MVCYEAAQEVEYHWNPRYWTGLRGGRKQDCERVVLCEMEAGNMRFFRPDCLSHLEPSLFGRYVYPYILLLFHSDSGLLSALNLLLVGITRRSCTLFGISCIIAILNCEPTDGARGSSGTIHLRSILVPTL